MSRGLPWTSAPAKAHESVPMVYDGRGNSKYAHHGRRGTRYCNHWFNIYRCPTCGRKASRMGSLLVCNGETIKRQNKKEKE